MNSGLSGQNKIEKKATVGFYNIENLFDTVDDPNIQDEEFLPEGVNAWTTEKYRQKQQNMARVIAGFAPDILGVSEIENRKVLEDLVQQPEIAGKRYQIAHLDMKDPRGVDVALIYRPAVFRPFSISAISIKDPKEPEFKTRDILWVKGLIFSDTLHVAVNHWPSRRGGKEDKRLLAAAVTRKAVDSVLRINPEAKIIIMGDLNDDPNNKSVRKILVKNEEKPGSQELFNASESTFKKGFGSLAYNGTWNLFDQIIMSPALRQNKGLVGYLQESYSIFAPKWMQETEGKYAGMPARTFRGNKFNPSGYSDHFPVFIILQAP
ncbi:MAG: endonuclease/exonuclease/phosphatase family protein [Cyclobacteriaceae bacterium]